MAAEDFGKYQLLKRLATGGMAQIYLARQKGPEGFEKLLVVKRILPHLAENDEFITMFLDEARIAARLNHPNVVQIFDLGAQDDSYFIAMEYIHGEDVRRVWKRAEAKGTAVPVPLVCRVIIDACSGLDYAHRKTDQNGKPLGIVHRDISPQNILVTFEGGVKVVDFGIAKAADQATVTRSGVLKGKYSYMSPEQAAGKKLDCRSDIFALGVVLYELLTGARLFKRSNDIQTLNAVTECAVAPPSQVNARVPADLDAVVMKALTKSPDDRYQEAVGLQMALEDWLLSHQLPSSPVHLASFMSEIYADRLAREAQEGKVLVEDLDASRAKDEEPSPHKHRATPSLPNLSRATSKSVKAPPPAARDVESTLADRPSRSGPVRARSVEKRLEALPAEGTRNPGTEVSRTQSRSGRTVPVLAGVALLAIAVLSYLLFLGPRPAVTGKAVVRITSKPSGATVMFHGKPVPEPTPCTLPVVPPGTYSLNLGLAGYRDLNTTVEVPEEGEVALPVFELEADRPVERDPPPPLPDAGPGEVAPPPIARVLLTVRSEPAGASATIGGQPQGKTPLNVEVAAGVPVTIRLILAGYKELERQAEVGQGPTQELSYPLERVKRVEVKVDPDRPKDPPRGFGTVVFVVKPWAKVVCGTHDLGETPFPEQRLPAGGYDCKFTNPDLKATQTRHIEVKANAPTQVINVKFE
ncbi:MAG: protein kinase domain-containing protein [Myxococcaceae bacterium]